MTALLKENNLIVAGLKMRGVVHYLRGGKRGGDIQVNRVLEK